MDAVTAAGGHRYIFVCVYMCMCVCVYVISLKHLRDILRCMHKVQSMVNGIHLMMIEFHPWLLRHKRFEAAPPTCSCISWYALCLFFSFWILFFILLFIYWSTVNTWSHVYIHFKVVHTKEIVIQSFFDAWYYAYIYF